MLNYLQWELTLYELPFADIFHKNAFLNVWESGKAEWIEDFWCRQKIPYSKPPSPFVRWERARLKWAWRGPWSAWACRSCTIGRQTSQCIRQRAPGPCSAPQAKWSHERTVSPGNVWTSASCLSVAWWASASSRTNIWTKAPTRRSQRLNSLQDLTLFNKKILIKNISIQIVTWFFKIHKMIKTVYKQRVFFI